MVPLACCSSDGHDQCCAGEREFVKDNKSLGNFRLDGIPPAPRGVPQVEVKFDIDANGILSVTATDKGTQKKQDIKITGASTLNSDEVDRMVQEAEKYSEEDKQKRDAVETKNQVCPLPDALMIPSIPVAGIVSSVIRCSCKRNKGSKTPCAVDMGVNYAPAPKRAFVTIHMTDSDPQLCSLLPSFADAFLQSL